MNGMSFHTGANIVSGEAVAALSTPPLFIVKRRFSAPGLLSV